MTLVRPIPPKRFAVARVNTVLYRVFSLAVAAVMVEAFVNSYQQFSILNPMVFGITVVAMGIGLLGILITAWGPGNTELWLGVFSIVAFIALVTWPLHFEPSTAPENFQPWIWWPLGIAMISGGASLRYGLGVAYMFLVPVIWFFLKTSPYAGDVTVVAALQDCVHLFTLPVALVSMVTALRWEAAKVDSANQLAIASAVESARVDALELERSRLDALVHDSVLTTLLLASRAQTPSERAAAAKSARDAIERLQSAEVSDELGDSLTLSSFASALELRVTDSAKDFEIETDRINDLIIPPYVALALTEATLQAVDNSMKHAPEATVRQVRIRGQKNGFKVVITDNGQGFRPSQIPKDRIGIRSSIIGRVEAVGGKVFLNTRPGEGTSVIIEWGPND